MVAAATPASRFAQRVEIRTTCRLAFIQVDTEDRPRKAELLPIVRGRSVGVVLPTKVAQSTDQRTQTTGEGVARVL